MRIRDRIKELRRVKASELLANPKNWRTHPKGQQRALRGILSEIGYADALLARELPDGSLELIDGHLRAETTPNQMVPVLIVDLNEDEANKLLAALDPMAAMAETDTAALRSLLEEMQTQSSGLQAMFDEMAKQAGIELDAAEEPTPDPEPQLDRAAELQKVWKTERGQVWEIVGKAGTHRLMCGDSTIAEDVAWVMGGAKAGLMNTDPPYGVGYANDDRPNPGVAKPRVAKPRVANDGLQDEKLQEFLESAFRAAVDCALTPNAAWYLWHAHLTQGFFAAAAAAAAANVVLHRQIIWVKSNMLLTRGQYHWKHEPCFFGWVKGHQPPDSGRGSGERDQTTLWHIDSIPQADRKAYNHATPKPAGLFTIPIVKHLKLGEVCFEPFAGSGPQFIAAEQLGRICHGIEISPAYCAVILQRCKDAGMKPKLTTGRN